MTRIIRSQVFLSLLVLIGLLPLAETATAQEGTSTFNAKLSYSQWRPGLAVGSVDGLELSICPDWWPWPWPWPWPWRWPPRPPKFDFRASYYDLEEKGVTRAIPLELGLQIPLSDTSRAIPYVEGGIGYYLIDGDAPGIGNEIGGYGALGVDIRLGDRWGLSLEGAYREIGGDLDLSGPVFKAGLGFSL